MLGAIAGPTACVWQQQTLPVESHRHASIPGRSILAFEALYPDGASLSNPDEVYICGLCARFFSAVGHTRRSPDEFMSSVCSSAHLRRTARPATGPNQTRIEARRCAYRIPLYVKNSRLYPLQPLELLGCQLLVRHGTDFVIWTSSGGWLQSWFIYIHANDVRSLQEKTGRQELRQLQGDARRQRTNQAHLCHPPQYLLPRADGVVFNVSVK
jgi:hypothetical protein